MRIWDVIVIGAGPAGSISAFELAGRGHSVLLLDRLPFPRGKVCGCCLNGAAVAQLEEAGLGELLDSAGALLLDSLNLFMRGRLIEIDLPRGFSLSREHLDQSLVEAARDRGVEFLTGYAATVGEIADGYRTVNLNDGGQVVEALAGRVVVVADGLSGLSLSQQKGFHVYTAPASRIGVGAAVMDAASFYERAVIYMAYSSRGYVGIVRLEDDRIDIAAALSREALRQAPDSGTVIASILQESGMPASPSLAGARWRGTKPLTARRARVAGERILVVGDSASYVEPFTGEGIAWALASARAAAPLAARAVERWDDFLAARWDYLYRQTIRRRQQTSKWIAHLLRRQSIAVPIGSLLARSPHLVSPIVRHLNQAIEVP